MVAPPSPDRLVEVLRLVMSTPALHTPGTAVAAFERLGWPVLHSSPRRGRYTVDAGLGVFTSVSFRDDHLHTVDVRVEPLQSRAAVTEAADGYAAALTRLLAAPHTAKGSRIFAARAWTGALRSDDVGVYVQLGTSEEMGYIY